MVLLEKLHNITPDSLKPYFHYFGP